MLTKSFAWQSIGLLSIDISTSPSSTNSCSSIPQCLWSEITSPAFISNTAIWVMLVSVSPLARSTRFIASGCSVGTRGRLVNVFFFIRYNYTFAANSLKIKLRNNLCRQISTNNMKTAIQSGLRFKNQGFR